jgi:hypothetical protein
MRTIVIYSNVAFGLENLIFSTILLNIHIFKTVMLDNLDF